MARTLPAFFALAGLLTLPQPVLAQDRADDRADDTVEFECPDDLGGLPDLIQRRCRAALAEGRYSTVRGLNTNVGPKGVKILIPVAAMAAAGIVLTSLKEDPPVSR